MNIAAKILAAIVLLLVAVIAATRVRRARALAGRQMVAVPDRLLYDMGLSRPAVATGFARIQAAGRGARGVPSR